MVETNDWMLKEDRDLLTARREEWRRKWEKERRRGKVYFIVVRYVLIWGGALILLNIGLRALEPEFLSGAQVKHICEGGAWTLLIGLLSGFWEWHSNENRYRRG